MSARDDRRWKVGELARATGLTVRALHHYDEVGLFEPSERTSGGHRLYAQQDVERLYRILALRRLGLRLNEIATLLDDDGVSLLETVRRHLEQVELELDQQQRLRERLRHLLDALERSIEPSAEQFIDTLEAMTVIEASVKDVLIWHFHSGEPGPPLEQNEPLPHQPMPHPPHAGQRAVLLEEHGGERVLPIWIGTPESQALALALCGRTPFRPLTADLTVRLLQVSDLRVERVVIESVRDFTFYATVVLTGRGESHEVDARPSDALNLAVRVGVPVFVAAELIDQAGAPAALLPLADPEQRPPPETRDTKGKRDREGSEKQPPGEWRSVLAEVKRPPEQSD